MNNLELEKKIWNALPDQTQRDDYTELITKIGGGRIDAITDVVVEVAGEVFLEEKLLEYSELILQKCLRGEI